MNREFQEFSCLITAIIWLDYCTTFLYPEMQNHQQKADDLADDLLKNPGNMYRRNLIGAGAISFRPGHFLSLKEIHTRNLTNGCMVWQRYLLSTNFFAIHVTFSVSNLKFGFLALHEAVFLNGKRIDYTIICSKNRTQLTWIKEIAVASWASLERWVPCRRDLGQLW